MATEKHLSITLIFSPAPREFRELLLVLPIGQRALNAKLGYMGAQGGG